MPDNLFFVYSENALDISEENSVFKAYFNDGNNQVLEPGINYSGESINLVPQIAFDIMADYPSDWFDDVQFKGAFGTFNWASGWTLLSRSGYLSD